jgi:hypothetical protein
MSNRLKLNISEIISATFFLFVYTAVSKMIDRELLANVLNRSPLVFLTGLAFIGWKFSKINKDFIAINRISRTPVEISRHS